MLNKKYFFIEGTEYELYQAASGDWCVSVSRYAQDREDYNIGSREEALEFILSDFECREEDEEDE